MCDQTEVAYLPNDIVWVKLSSVWWPAQVQDQEKLPESVTSGLRKKPLTIVKFFEEDTYEYIRNLDRIYHYNCLKKDDFIRKGLDLCRARSSRDVPSNMRMFPKDVTIAEKLTGGDPNIVDDPRFLPKKKFDYRQLFESPSKGTKKSPRTPRTPQPNAVQSFSASPPTENRVITHPRIIQKAITGKSDYESKIRLQSTTPRDESELKNYACQACGFKTTRINVFILHNKSHMDNYASTTPLRNDGGGHSSRQSFPPTPKSSSTPKPKKEKSTVKRKATEEAPKSVAKRKPESTPSQSKPPPRNESFQKTPVRRRGKSKEEKAAALKKKNEAIRETLLKDWDDEDSVEEEEEIERLKLNSSEELSEQESPTKDELASTSQSVASEKAKEPEGPPPPKEISCFDFEDNEESINLNESMKFGQKLPRVIGDEKTKKQNEERNALKKDLASRQDKEPDDFLNLDVEFKSILDETKVPEVPDIPKSLLSSLPKKIVEEDPNRSEQSIEFKSEDYLMEDEDTSDGTQIVEQEVIVFDDSEGTEDKILKDDASEFDVPEGKPTDSNQNFDENTKSPSKTPYEIPKVNENIESNTTNEKEENDELKDQSNKLSSLSCKETENMAQIHLNESEQTNKQTELQSHSESPQIGTEMNHQKSENLKSDLKEIEESTMSESAPLVVSITGTKKDVGVGMETEETQTIVVGVSEEAQEQIILQETNDQEYEVPIANLNTLSSGQEIVISQNSGNETQDMQQMDLDINSMPIVIEEDILPRNDPPQPLPQNISKIKIHLRKVGSESESKPETGQRVITIPGTRKTPTVVVPSSQEVSHPTKKVQGIKAKAVPNLLQQKGPGSASQLVIVKQQSSSGTSKYTLGKNQSQKQAQVISQVISPTVMNQSQVLTQSQVVTSRPGKVFILPSTSIGGNQILKVATQQKSLGVKTTTGTRIITNKTHVISQTAHKGTGSVITSTRAGQTVLLNKGPAGVISTKNVILKQPPLPSQSVLSSKGVKSITVSKPIVGSSNLMVANIGSMPLKGNTGSQKLQLIPQKAATKMVLQGKSKIMTTSSSQIKVIPKVQTNTVFIKTNQGLFPATQTSAQPIRSNQISLVGNQSQPKKTPQAKVRQVTPNILQRSKRKQNTRNTQKQQFINIPSTTIQANDIILPANSVPVLSQTPSTQTEPLKMVYLTVDEHGNCHPVNDQSILSFNTKTSENNTLYINTGASEGEKIFFLDQSGSVMDILQNATPTTSATTTASQDILAKALANTQVLQSETTDIPSSFDTPIFVDQQYPAPTLSHNVLETSLTLNQPIMTPLEVPSSVSPSALSQISSAYLPVSTVGEKPKVPGIQPSMPLLTDELEVPTQTVYLNSDNIPVTSGTPITLQLTLNDNMVVTSSSGNVQNFEEPTTSLSPNSLAQDTLVISTPKISQASEDNSVVSHLVLSPNFNISDKTQIYEQKSLENVLQVGLNQDMTTETVGIHVVTSGGEFLSENNTNTMKFYTEVNSEPKLALPPGSEYLNSSETNSEKPAENEESPETKLVNLKEDQETPNHVDEQFSSGKDDSVANKNDENVVSDQTKSEEVTEAQKVLDEAAEKNDAYNETDSNLVIAETPKEEPEIDSEKEELLNLPAEPIETETVHQSEVYTNSNDIRSDDETHIEVDDSQTTDDDPQKLCLNEESREWVIMEDQSEQSEVSAEKQEFYHENSAPECKISTEGIKTIQFASKECGEKDSIEVPDRMVIVDSETTKEDLEKTEDDLNKRPADHLSLSEQPTPKRLRGEDER